MDYNLISSHRFSREAATEKNDILLKDGWTAWKEVMVPAVAPNPKNKFSRRPTGQNGYRREDLTTLFHPFAHSCGIYEWRAIRNDKVVVVYIGSTCTTKYGRLSTRIKKYCSDGSHKKSYINDALEKEYALEVRLKPAQDKLEAERLENELLDKYDYAWNERRNGIRKIL